MKEVKLPLEHESNSKTQKEKTERLVKNQEEKIYPLVREKQVEVREKLDPDLGRRPPRSKRLKWILGGETPKI